MQWWLTATQPRFGAPAPSERHLDYEELKDGAGGKVLGAVAGMQKTLTTLRDEKEVQESSGLVIPFAERQRLVGKPEWDAMEKRYT